MTYNQKALKQYQSVDLETSVSSASPHKLISMLLDGVLTALVRSKGLMEQKQFEAKGKQIGKASRIIVHLKGSLDHEKGGEVSDNLDRLYDYMLQKLLQANRNNDPAAIDEVYALVTQVKEGWDQMPEEEKNKQAP